MIFIYYLLFPQLVQGPLGIIGAKMLPKTTGLAKGFAIIFGVGGVYTGLIGTL
jgi:hypothetical protein